MKQENLSSNQHLLLHNIRSRIRMGLLTYLQQIDYHPTAKEIHQAGHPQVSFSTV